MVFYVNLNFLYMRIKNSISNYLTKFALNLLFLQPATFNNKSWSHREEPAVSTKHIDLQAVKVYD